MRGGAPESAWAIVGEWHSEWNHGCLSPKTIGYNTEEAAKTAWICLHSSISCIRQQSRESEGGEERLGAAFIAFMVARVLLPWLPAWRNTIASPARATMKAHPTSTTLAPTCIVSHHRHLPVYTTSYPFETPSRPSPKGLAYLVTGTM